MRRYWIVALGIALAVLALFLAAESLGLDLLRSQRAPLGERGVAAAALGVGLLVVDVLLPVPSSVVMVAHGALFGVWLGALLSLLGSVGALLVGFAIGRAGGPVLGRLVPEEERVRADRLLRRWGALAIMATRPIPILAETVAILAGSSPMGWVSAAGAAALGSAVPALLYAVAGAHATGLASGAAVFGGVLLVSAAFWMVGRRLRP